MKLNILTSVLSLASAVLAAPSLGLEKRVPEGPFKLVAYGVASGPANFFYSDGMTSINISDLVLGFPKETSMLIGSI